MDFVRAKPCFYLGIRPHLLGKEDVHRAQLRTREQNMSYVYKSICQTVQAQVWVLCTDVRPRLLADGDIRRAQLRIRKLNSVTCQQVDIP